jgi:hypothetical protein
MAAKDVLEAWDNRVEYDFISSPGMAQARRGDDHFSSSRVRQFKDGKLISDVTEVTTTIVNEVPNA